MRIFISWSGERSQKVAELLSNWLKCVIQASKPWISSDMDRGVVWFNTINEVLADTSTGIVCLTAENLNSSWILFEAGSLSNGLTDKRVCTFLVDIKPTDIKPPLSQFNHTEPNKTSVQNLVKTINERLGDKRLESDTLNTVFETYYPQFEKQFNEIISRTEMTKGNITENTPKRSEQEVLEEVLLTVRNLNQRIQRIENPTYIRNSRTTTRKYKIKDEIINNVITRNEQLLINIVKGDDKEIAFESLVKRIAQENDIPLSLAREVAQSCIDIMNMEYEEYLADTIRG